MTEALHPGEAGKKEILRRRAENLARMPVKKETGKLIQLVEFLLGKERYALEAACVTLAEPVKELTPIPGVPDYVPGVINWQGEILWVVDLFTLFRLSGERRRTEGCALIMKVPEKKFAVWVDELLGIREVNPTGWQTSLPFASESLGQALKGVDQEGLIVLDGRRLPVEA